MTKKTINLGDGYRGKIELTPDDFPENPVETGRIGSLQVFEDKQSFWKAVEQEFGEGEESQEVILSLVEGNLLQKDGKIYYGIERYRHSGDAYAVCKQGNFVDRQFDVSPIVGFGFIDVSSDEDVVSSFNKDDVESVKAVMERLASHLEEYTSWANGDVWCYKIALEKDGEEVFSDETSGVFGMYECEKYAEETLKEKVLELSQKPVRRSKIR